MSCIARGLSRWLSDVMVWLRCFPRPHVARKFGAGRRRLTAAEAERALQLHDSGVSVREISRLTGLSRTAISRLCTARSTETLLKTMILRAAKRRFREDTQLRDELVHQFVERLAQRPVERRLMNSLGLSSPSAASTSRNRAAKNPL